MRKQNWPMILTEKIEQFKTHPFVWGETDCLHFACRVASAMLDYDLYETAKASSFLYDTEEGAALMLEEHFNKDMGNVFSSLFDEVSPKLAQRGDVAICEFNGKEICGVIDSSGRSVACKSKDGILFLPISRVARAWRVE